MANKLEIFYPENYGIYVDLLKHGSIKIQSIEINKDSWSYHYNCILSILKDYIENEDVMRLFISVDFGNIEVDLNVVDYYFNIIMWRLKTAINEPIRPNNIFFNPAITRKGIKYYIDTQFLQNNRTRYPNILLNNIIDDCLVKYNDIDNFSFYLCNTINIEDDIKLMNQFPEAYDIYHTDLSSIPLEQVKKVGMERTHKLIEYIKNSDHCLSPFFKSGEGINIKQYKECMTNIGPKPDGFGNVHHEIINTNYLLGGVNDETSYCIESGASRFAQIIVDENTGDSGYFARLLGLNNVDTFINEDPNYDCHTRNYVRITIDSETMLSKYENRYFKYVENGALYRITSNSKDIIGKEILLRSPMTCLSHARGHGICYKCYGDLAYTNNDINIGKIAAELMSNKITQKMLSAKHLLEAEIKKLKWTEGFYKYMELDCNVIQLANMDFRGYKMIINPENVILEEDNNTEYITEFIIIDPQGNELPVYTEDMDSLYITIDLNNAIRDHAINENEMLCIDMKNLADIPLFTITIHNNELSKILKDIKNCIENNKTALKECNYNKDVLLVRLMKYLSDGGISINSVHAEIILSNQIRDLYDSLNKPDWSEPNVEYEIVGLKKALEENPSVTIGLAFEKIDKMLYNPLTFRKNKPSFFDLFFMENPDQYLKSDKYIYKENKESKILAKFKK